MSRYVEDLKKLEKSRGATFTLEGVIAARTPESGQRTHDAISHVCDVIISAYRSANDSDKNTDDKKREILKVVELEGDLDWLATFVQDETQNCRFAQHVETMTKVLSTILLLTV
jgi:hypothetical protein